MSGPLILDLCGGTGSWSAPYREALYSVVVVDPLAEGPNAYRGTVRDWLADTSYRRWGSAACYANPTVHGILAAPPCDHFARSGAAWWKAKDADGRTAIGVQIVRDCLEVVKRFKPVWWALENPMGRIEKLVPELGRPCLRFHPSDYGDAYNKRTQLWGKFRPPMFKPVIPEFYMDSKGNRYSWQFMKLGGKSARTKRLRSMTPPGFAKAFMEANP